MALISRLLRALFTTVIRAGALFVALFVVYLIIDQAWPTYRALADTAAERPVLEQEVMKLQGELRRREAHAARLRQQLETLAATELLALRQNVESFEAALVDIDARREKLERDLTAAASEEAEYCSSWNPLKRWLCSEVRERTQRAREAIALVLDELAPARDEIGRQLALAADALRQYEQLPAEQRGTTADGQRIKAELSEQTHERQVTQKLLLELEARLARAKAAEGSPWVWVTRKWREVAWPLGLIVLMVLVAPWVHRVVLYFVVMPWVSRASAVTLCSTASGELHCGRGVRTLNLTLNQGESCWARADYVRPVSGKTHSQWLFDWGAPLVSYAAGLSILTRIDGGASEDGGVAAATLASPTESDSYLLELTLSQHPGFIFHPRHLIAVVGDVELFTVWRLFSVHSWLTGQLRYIGLRGTGRCILEGFGDVIVRESTQSPTRIEQELIIGFDARLQYSTARTETFLPYFLGRTPLVDDVFRGHGSYVWQKNTQRRPRTLGERSFELLFGAIGKLLGF